MRTGLERIAANARQEPKRRCTSVAPHLEAERLWQHRCRVPHHTAPGSEGQTADAVKQGFAVWREATRRVGHTHGYRPPPGRRTDIPKPGKPELRPLGVPCIGDRVLQRCGADVLTAIDAPEFLPGSVGGRPGVGAHHARATRHDVIAGTPVSWVYEADRRNFFGSLDQGWLLRGGPHRVGDPRRVSLIRRWRKAGVLEDGLIEPSDEGVPQGGHIRVVLSNLSLHYVRDLWCERVVKPRLPGDAYLIRDLDEFVVCCQPQADAHRVQQVLVNRLAKFAVALEPSTTRLVAFGRVAERQAKRQGRRRETCTVLGVTLYCTRNRRGHCTVGWRTDKARLRRSLATRHQVRQRIRHEPLNAQATQITQILRGHDAYDGLAGNLGSLLRVYRRVERHWRKMRSRRRPKAQVRWEVF